MDDDSIRQDLIDQLDRLFGKHFPDAMPVMAEGVDSFIPKYIHAYLIKESANKFPTQNEYSEYIRKGRDTYQITISPEIFDPSILNIAIIPLGIESDGKRPPKQSVKINGIGQYQKVNIYIPPNSPVCIKTASDNIRTILIEAYSWLHEQLRSSIFQTVEDIEVQLLSKMRHYFSSRQKERFLDETWLIIVSKDHAYYAIDPLKFEQSIAKAGGSEKSIRKSRAALASEFISNAILFEDTFSSLAFSNKSRIDADISEAKYKPEKTNFQLSQEAIYDTSSMSFFPLVEANGAYLVGVYPTEISEHVDPIFQSCKSDFERIVKTNTSTFNKSWERLNRYGKRNIDTGSIGEFFGGVIKALSS